jgi:hypothetical protein
MFLVNIISKCIPMFYFLEIAMYNIYYVFVRLLARAGARVND